MDMLQHFLKESLIKNYGKDYLETHSNDDKQRDKRDITVVAVHLCNIYHQKLVESLEKPSEINQFKACTNHFLML